MFKSSTALVIDSEMSVSLVAMWSTTLRDLYRLTKPNLTLLVVVTTLLGLFLGAVGPIPWPLMLATLSGTWLSAGGACALNMYVEREADAKMPRTAARPLASGRLSPGLALGFSLALIAAGGSVLAVWVNGLTSLLSLLAAGVYILVYTPLKARSPWATVVGAIPGALPPMMGWTAVRDGFGLQAWIVFFILFFWQLPHFWALALLYRKDYNYGGFRVVPRGNSQNQLEIQIIAATIILLAVSASLSWFGAQGLIYLFGSLIAGGGMLWTGVRLQRTHTPRDARRVFLASLAYLPVLIGFLVVDHPHTLRHLFGF